MADRAIFLDRDNTIIENDGYLGDASKVKLLPGAATAIAALRRLGYRVVVVSNQSGVARGMFREEDVQAVNDEMCRQLREQAGAFIDASYYCPYHPEAKLPEYRVDHDWRKPKPGMLKQAALDFELDLAASWTIGDQPRDIAAGAAAGCRTILLRDPDHPGADTDPGAGGGGVSPNFIVKTLSDAARIVSREGRSANPDAVPMPLVVKLEAAGGAPAAVREVAASAPALAAPRVDEAALAARVADAVSRAMPAPKGDGRDKQLEELIIQLRHAQRQQEYQPEFSLATLGAVVLQIVVILLAGLGLSRSMDVANVADVQQQFIVIQKSQTWLLLAIILQGVVLLLFLVGRKKG